MSLRTIHLIFIALCIALAAFFAAWAFAQYGRAQQAGFAVTGVIAAAVAVALAMYGAAFRRKTRRMS